jgi:hypothetical protein
VEGRQGTKADWAGAAPAACHGSALPRASQGRWARAAAKRRPAGGGRARLAYAARKRSAPMGSAAGPAWASRSSSER